MFYGGIHDIHDGRVAIAEEWSILVRAYGGEKNIGRNNQIQRKMVFYCLLWFFVPDIRSGIPCTAPHPHPTTPPVKINIVRRSW